MARHPREAFIPQEVPIASSDKVRNQFERVRKTICQVAGGGIIGSGFLISQRHMLTAYHTYEDIKAKLGPNDIIRVHFETLDARHQVHEIRLSRFEPVVHSPTDGLDYAVFEVPKGISYQLVVKAHKDLRVRNRGWLPIPQNGEMCGVGTDVLVCAFTDNEVRYTQGKVSPQTQESRVAYDAGTCDGYSGGPVVALGIVLAHAMHQAPHETEKVNVGLALSAILADVQRRAQSESSGRISELHNMLTDSTMDYVRELPTTDDGTPILFRRSIFDAFRNFRQGAHGKPLFARGPEKCGRTYLAEICRRMFPGDFIIELDLRTLGSSISSVTAPLAGARVPLNQVDLNRAEFSKAILRQVKREWDGMRFLPISSHQTDASLNNRVATEILYDLRQVHIETDRPIWLFLDNADHAEISLLELIDSIARQLNEQPSEIFMVLTGANAPRPTATTYYQDMPLDTMEAVEVRDCIRVLLTCRTRGNEQSAINPNHLATKFMREWQRSNEPAVERARSLLAFIGTLP